MWPKAVVIRLENLKWSSTQRGSLTRSVILVDGDFGNIRSGDCGWVVFLIGHGGSFARNRTTLLIVAFPVVSFFEDEFLPVDEPTLLDRTVVRLSASFRGLGGGSFSPFLLLLPLSAVFRRLCVDCLLPFLFPLLKFLLIGFLAGNVRDSKAIATRSVPSLTHPPSILDVHTPFVDQLCKRETRRSQPRRWNLGRSSSSRVPVESSFPSVVEGCMRVLTGP